MRAINPRRLALPALLVLLLPLVVILQGHKFATVGEAFSSDNLYTVAFCDDLLGRGHALTGWHLPGAPYLFPDIALLLPCRLLFRDVALLFLAYALLFTAALSQALAWVAREAGLAARDAFLIGCSGALLINAVPLGQRYVDDGSLLYHSGNHMGAVLTGLVLLALSLRFLRRGYRAAWAVAFVVIGGFGAVSDKLLVVQFLIPIALSALLLGYRRLLPWRQALALLALIGGAQLLAWATARGLSTRLGFVLLQQEEWPDFGRRLALRPVLAVLRDYFRGKVLLLTILAVYAVVALALVRRRIVAVDSRPGDLAAPESPGLRKSVALLAPTLALVGVCNLAVVGTYALGGGIVPVAVPRYLLGFCWLPVLCLGLLLRQLRGSWVTRIGRAFPVLAAVAAVTQIGLHGRGLSGQSFRQPYPPVVRELDDLARRRGSQCGLAGYWDARRMTFLCRAGVRVKAIVPPAQPYLHADNPNSFLPRDPHDLRLPEYDFLVIGPKRAPHPEPDALRAEYGDPDEVRPAGDHEIWVYDRLRSRNLDLFLQGLLEQKLLRVSSPSAPTRPSQLARPKRYLSPALAPGNDFIAPGGTLEVAFAGPTSGRTLDVAIGSSDECEVVFCNGTECLGAVRVPRVAWAVEFYRPPPWLVPRLLPIPAEVGERRWDRLLVRAPATGGIVVGHVLVFKEAIEPLPDWHLEPVPPRLSPAIWAAAAGPTP
jgi:hypothetical protein